MLLSKFIFAALFVDCLASVEDQRCNITRFWRSWGFTRDCSLKYVTPNKLRDSAIVRCRGTQFKYLQSFKLFAFYNNYRDKRKCPKVKHKFSTIDHACCDKPGQNQYTPKQCHPSNAPTKLSNTCHTINTLKNIIGSSRSTYNESCGRIKSTDPKKFWSLTNWDGYNSQCALTTMLKVERFSCCETLIPTPTIVTTTNTRVAPTEVAAASKLSTDTRIGLIIGGIFASLIMVFIVAMISIRQKKHKDRLEDLMKSYIQLAEGNNANAGYPADGDQYEFEEVTYADPAPTRPVRSVAHVIEVRQAKPPPPEIQRTVSRRKQKRDGTVTEKVTTERIVHDDGGSVTDLTDATSIIRPKKHRRTKSQLAYSVVDDEPTVRRKVSKRRSLVFDATGSETTIGSRRKKSTKRRKITDESVADDNTETAQTTRRTVRKRQRSIRQ